MTSVAKRQKIDELMEKSSAALARMSYFEAERMAFKALNMAWQNNSYERMARIVLPLQEARRQRLQLALDTGSVTLIDEQPVSEDVKINPGCYLVCPPLVGADARRLRIAALQQEVPVAVVCFEPIAQTGLLPIVATIPGKSYRTKIKPPDDPDNLELAWFAGAMEAVGDTAIASIDPEKTVERRIEALLEMLDAMPEHEGLHQILEDTCREAMQLHPTDASSSEAAV